MKHRTKLNQFLELKMNFNKILILIQYLLPILGLNGLKKSLRPMGTWPEIPLTIGEQDLSFNMGDLRYVMQIHFF